ncbi:MAG: hypothetical protein JSU73_01305 [candidate division WOR-3 bacterium]|nr:MAG: hypothetical protein JSU73_01305 [candidate division WOR-3 bacterium]
MIRIATAFALLLPALLLAHDGSPRLSRSPEERFCGMELIDPFLPETYRPSRPTLTGPVSYRVKTNFRVHYTTRGADSTSWQYAESVAVYAESCRARVIRLGWYPPPPDQGVGGDDRYDYYVRQISGAVGVTPPDSAYTNPFPDGYSSWIEVDPGVSWASLRSLVAHEFHHAVQERYSKFEQPFWWFYENTSTWMEDILFPGYGGLYGRTRWNPSPLLATHYAINSRAGNYEYPGGLWPKFLAEYYGADVPRRVWDLCGRHSGDHVQQDTDSVLRTYCGSGIENAVAHYAIWRYFTGTRDDNLHYDQAERCTTAVLLRTHTTYPASGTEGTWDPRGPGGMDLVEFRTNGSQDLTVSFNGANGYTWRAYVLARRGSATYEQRIVLNSNGDGSITIPSWMVLTAVLIPVVVQWSDANDSTPALTFSYSASVADAYAAMADVETESLFLGQSIPNPVRDAARIAYALQQGERGMLVIRDAAGSTVREYAVAGQGTVAWDGRDREGRRLPAGVLFCQLTAGGKSVRNKLILE